MATKVVDAKVADATKPDTKDEKKVTVPIEDVIVHGKYNAALFLPSKLGEDTKVVGVIHRGLELIATRKVIQRGLMRGDDDIFVDNNHMSADFKLEKLDICSYCAKTSDRLYLYFSVIHAEDLITKELVKLQEKKEAAFKHIRVWQLETKMRDVRQPEPFIINQGCYLICPARCQDCLNSTPKIEVIEKETQTDK